MTTELNLIPESYRREQARNLQLRVAGTALLVMFLAGIAAAASFHLMTRSVVAKRAQLQLERSLTEQRSAEYARLSDLRGSLRAQFATLLGLRGGAPAAHLMLTIDRALPEAGVWFQEWEFRRAGLVEDTGSANLTDTGYFIVKPAAMSNDENRLRIQTHMKIRGQAADHAALSRFVRNLFAQPEILDVRLLRTSSRRYLSATLVDFDLAIILRSEVQPG